MRRVGVALIPYAYAADIVSERFRQIGLRHMKALTPLPKSVVRLDHQERGGSIFYEERKPLQKKLPVIDTKTFRVPRLSSPCLPACGVAKQLGDIEMIEIVGKRDRRRRHKRK